MGPLPPHRSWWVSFQFLIPPPSGGTPRPPSVPCWVPIAGQFLCCFYSLMSPFCPPFSAQLSVNNKPPNSEGQGEKKDNATAPPAPPTYEEATAGEGMKSGAYPPPPSVPLHPSWAYVDPSKSSCGCTQGELFAEGVEGCRDSP